MRGGAPPGARQSSRARLATLADAGERWRDRGSPCRRRQRTPPQLSCTRACPALPCPVLSCPVLPCHVALPSTAAGTSSPTCWCVVLRAGSPARIPAAQASVTWLAATLAGGGQGMGIEPSMSRRVPALLVLQRQSPRRCKKLSETEKAASAPASTGVHLAPCSHRVAREEALGARLRAWRSRTPFSFTKKRA